MTATPNISPRDMANAIRALAMDAVERAQSGHAGMPMGMADIAAALFTKFLKFDPADPDWPDRDRFVLSNGHGSMLLYAALCLTGYADMTMDELRNFRQLGSRTPGHPEYGCCGGVETTTGPLGQGLANAVGMALAERMLAAEFGPDLVDHHTFVFCGDGCLMEGLSHEAASLAGHLRLDRLVVLFDDNAITIDGATALSVSDDQRQRFEAYGWRTDAVDGHDANAIEAAIAAARVADRPSLIACRTIIGFGAPTKAGTAAAHGAPLGAEEIAGARAALGWRRPPFHIPDDIAAAWRAAGARGARQNAAWRARLEASPRRVEFAKRIAGVLPAGLAAAIAEAKAALRAKPPSLTTREASQRALEALVPATPALVGGSADLTGSNNTRTKSYDMRRVRAGDYGGRYIFYGVREHGMAAAMNGLALHGGFIPYSGAFLVFSDYMRPALRLAALMKQRVIHVLTHDSIGLGEDGPTHQPVEHLAALRAIPNLWVFRPADAVETLECWELALKRGDGPSVLALTRQGLAPLPRSDSEQNRCARGAYVVAEAGGGDGGRGARRATLLATGSEVQVALAARDALEAQGVGVAVVSMPCLELFAIQPEDEQAAVLGRDTVRVAVEAAIPFGWERWVGPEGAVVGMAGFGASAPAKDLFAHFGVTAENVVKAVTARL